jgi:hypothetical protein
MSSVVLADASLSRPCTTLMDAAADEEAGVLVGGSCGVAQSGRPKRCSTG